MHDLIHLCDVAETPAALHDKGCVFGPQINTQSQKHWLSATTDKSSSRGEKRRVADAKPGNLSFNLQSYIGYFKTHMTHVQVNM